MPFLALVFMTVTGSVQVISYIVLLFMWKRIHIKLRKYLIIYPLLAGIVLGILSIDKGDISFTISIFLSVIIAIGFLLLLKKQKDKSLKLSTDEL